MGKRILQSLIRIKWKNLTPNERLSMVRTYQVAMVRFGKPYTSRKKIINHLDTQFTAKNFAMNSLLCNNLAFLEVPTAARKRIALLRQAPTQEEQMEYKCSLRNLRSGWTYEQRSQYLNWFLKSANYRGGASFTKFIEFIRDDAVASLSPKRTKNLASLLAKKPEIKTPAEVVAEVMAGRTIVKNWKMDELSNSASNGLVGRDFEGGRKMFAAGVCYACHHFGNQLGMNRPDLTGSGGR